LAGDFGQGGETKPPALGKTTTKQERLGKPQGFPSKNIMAERGGKCCKQKGGMCGPPGPAPEGGGFFQTAELLNVARQPKNTNPPDDPVWAWGPQPRNAQEGGAISKNCGMESRDYENSRVLTSKPARKKAKAPWPVQL